MTTQNKAKAIERAAKIIELEKKVNAGQRAQSEYNKKQEQLSELYSRFRLYHTYETDFEEKSQADSLDQELKDLEIIIQEGKRAQKSLNRMRQTDTRNAQACENKQRTEKMQKLMNQHAELERAIAELDTRIENRSIDLDVESYSGDLHDESERELDYITAERDRLQSQLNTIVMELHNQKNEF